VGQLFIFGDSHTIAIKKALGARDAADRRIAGIEPVIDVFTKVKAGVQLEGVTEQEVAEHLSGAAPGATLVAVVGGNQANSVGMIQHPEPFDFIDPDYPDAPLREGAVCVPYRVIAASLAFSIRGKDFTLLEKMRQAFGGRMFQLAPPPPKADGAYVLRHAESVFRAGDMSLGISPAPLRLKLWRAQVRESSRILAEAGITMLPPPQSALTPDGYLAEPFYGDATHGNALYGEEVLGMLDHALRQTAATPA
jgi:hypothetical protein